MTNPALAFIHAYLASAYALNGEAERAAAERGRTLLQHYTPKGHSILWGAEGP